MVQYCLVMLGSGSEPRLLVRHTIVGVDNQYSTVCGVARIISILCLVLSHPIMSTKCPSVSPAFGDKKDKAITDAPQLIMGLYPDNVSVLNIFKVD